MAGCEPPSFSLGLDLGLDWEPQDEVFGPEVLDSDPEIGPEPPRILKRLRRGPTTATKTPLLQKRLDSPQSFCARDDEIEEFSSQDGDFLRDAHPPLQYQSMCSSSKIPLHGCGFLTTQSSSQGKARKRKQFSDTPASASLEMSGNLSTLPKLTISPLRRFQLIDSDSDDPSSHDNVSREAHKPGQSSTERQSNPDHSATLSEQKRKVSPDVNKNEDLWKDFCPMKSFRIQTPALDEGNTTSSRKDGQVWDSDDPVPPAHHYFFHDDPRVQKLVRDRLPNFSPLGVLKNRGNQQPNASVIDYMRQFCHEEASKQQTTCKSNVEKSSTMGRNKSKLSNAKEVLLPSGGWMDPKTPASTPKDAGQRRVHANGQSAGHWYTNPEGRKVYATKAGKELTGRSAYRQYRKESGAGVRKSKKKTSAKKRKG
ncbi:hypothetical protein SLA2020_451890 [Shorea laevis]